MELRRSGNSIEMVEEQGRSSEEGQNARLHTTPEVPARANLMQATKTHMHVILKDLSVKIGVEFKTFSRLTKELIKEGGKRS